MHAGAVSHIGTPAELEDLWEKSAQSLTIHKIGHSIASQVATADDGRPLVAFYDPLITRP